MTSREESATEPLDRVEARIGYRFADRSLLEQALTHRSFANENRVANAADNQRLEFLGDAVLSLVVGRMLFVRFPDAAEGFLTQSRADLVNAASLAGIARRLELASCLRIGRGLARGGGVDTDNILSDAFEALIGAVFLDGGFARANEVAESLFVEACEQVVRHPGREDYKTRLQELLQKNWQVRPEYRITADGPVHQCHYAVDVVWDGQVRGRGEGSSKKRAEQEAARQAIESLQGGESLNND